MGYTLVLKPEHLEAIRRRGPGQLLGRARGLPPHLQKVMEKLLQRGTVVQINETADAREARWLTLCPHCKKGYLLIWLAPSLKIEMQCLIPHLAVGVGGESLPEDGSQGGAHE
jgi:hypothetical protein